MINDQVTDFLIALGRLVFNNDIIENKATTTELAKQDNK